jgi:hypothetical protein
MTIRRGSLSLVVAAAAAALLADGRASGRPAPRFSVHEWGTLTAVAGTRGDPLMWRPLAAPQDLPRFVYSLGASADSRFRSKSAMAALARLETPVLYIHADEPFQASISARFPAGLLTEWYPQARAGGSELRWARVEVRPGEAIAFPSEDEPSHYYQARRAKAAPLTVRSERSAEHEGFLFYRGVGMVDLPLRVASAQGRLRVERLANAPAEAILFENLDGRVAWERVALEGRQTWIERPPAAGVTELEVELADLLVAQGLFPDEADAMIATWAESWFEEGVRVFYLMPRAQVDAVLPLRVDPQPADLARVMVGRLELITPERRDALRVRLVALDEEALDGDLDATRRSIGRFADPLLRELLAVERDEAIAGLARRLLGAGS